MTLRLEPPKRNLRAAIVDDDRTAIDVLLAYIHVTDGLELAFISMDPREGLARLQKEHVDVLFLDMEMPVMDGIQFLSQLKVAHLQVVVCSAYDRFAAETYGFQVADYLVKPFHFTRYMDAIHVVKERIGPIGLNRLEEKNNCLMIWSDRGTVVCRLEYDQIVYVEADEEKTRLWTGPDRYYEIREKFGKTVSLLPKALFTKIHRSYAISLGHFVKKTDKKVVLRGIPQEIPYGDRKKYPLFENWLAENAMRGKLVSRENKKKQS